MNKEVLLYFRTVADEDNDDNNGAQTSVVFPASSIVTKFTVKNLCSFLLVF